MLVPGIFPNTAVWGLVTCNNSLATERATYNIHSKQFQRRSQRIIICNQKIQVDSRDLIFYFVRTAMRSPISTEMKTTPKKAPAMAMKSPKSTFQILYMAL